MKILNYTGEDIGLVDEEGQPARVLPSSGKAIITKPEEQKMKVADRIPIYRRYGSIVRFLPAPTGNLDQMYIVNKDVADAARSTRFDLLIVDELVRFHGANFYKKLINA